MMHNFNAILLLLEKAKFIDVGFNKLIYLDGK